MADRKCPDCGERLSFDAIRCACGWGQKRGEKGKYFDHRCTYRAGSERCGYPVGMFPEGNTSGWCVFHRQNLDQASGAEVVSQSSRVKYLDAIQPMLDAAKNAPGVVDTAWEIALRTGNRAWPSDADKVGYLSDAGRHGAKAA